MRLYGKKFLKQNIITQVQQRQETRDAILWDVLPTQRLCRVKIQGSNTLIVAHYPENWVKTPTWLKPGNAVKIMHTQGVRGRIELIGHGQCIPTPVSGGTTPPVAPSPDVILTGCYISQCPNQPRMVVLVYIGTYRITEVSEIIYTLGPISMLYGDNFKMGDGGKMEQIAGAVAINAAPSTGYYRYDLISVGSNGVLDYTAGTPALSSPVKPSLAASHVMCGNHILVPYGRTAIAQELVGLTWSIPKPTVIVMTIADKDLSWSPLQLSTTVKVEVFDQYGNALVTTGYGWYITLEIIAGNGYVSSTEEGESDTKIGSHTGSLSYYTFGYRRDGAPGDQSPALQAVLEIEYPLITADAIVVHTS